VGVSRPGPVVCQVHHGTDRLAFGYTFTGRLWCVIPLSRGKPIPAFRVCAVGVLANDSRASATLIWSGATRVQNTPFLLLDMCSVIGAGLLSLAYAAGIEAGTWKRLNGFALVVAECCRTCDSHPQICMNALILLAVGNWRRWMGIEPTWDFVEPHAGFEDQERHQAALHLHLPEPDFRTLKTRRTSFPSGPACCCAGAQPARTVLYGGFRGLYQPQYGGCGQSSADLQSAVSQICNPQTIGTPVAHRAFPEPADCKSAIQQTASPRYFHWSNPWVAPELFGLDNGTGTLHIRRANSWFNRQYTTITVRS
jgi:hypothetical protein